MAESIIGRKSGSALKVSREVYSSIENENLDETKKAVSEIGEQVLKKELYDLAEDAAEDAKEEKEKIKDVVSDLAETIRKSESNNDSKKQGDISFIIKNGKISADDLKANPSVFNGKSANEIAQVLKDSGYDVTIKKSAKSKSGAQIIKINNLGSGRNISQVQVSPGGGRHGNNPYVKISTTDQGIIKIINGPESLYKTDGKETATIIFSGGK